MTDEIRKFIRTEYDKEPGYHDNITLGQILKYVDLVLDKIKRHEFGPDIGHDLEVILREEA
jgi:hypothetical protein